MSEGERGNQGVMFSLAIHRASVIVQPGAADADKAAGWVGGDRSLPQLGK